MSCCDECANGAPTCGGGSATARMRAALLAPVRPCDVRMRGVDSQETRETVQGGAAAGAEAYAPGTGPAAAWLAGKSFDFGASLHGDQDCKPGEDPNDPECDGVQVVTGVRICGPNEDPSSGCVRDSNTRGAPSAAAFPSAEIDVTGSRAREADRTREAQATYEAEAAGIERTERGLFSTGETAAMAVFGFVVGGVVVGGITAGISALAKSKHVARNAMIGAGIGGTLDAASVVFASSMWNRQARGQNT